MAKVKLYSRRDEGNYALLEYDTETKGMLVLEGQFGGKTAGDTFTWLSNETPWQDPGSLTGIDNRTGEVIGQTDFIRAKYERVVEGCEPSPGYGPTPDPDEHFIAGLTDFLERAIQD